MKRTISVILVLILALTSLSAAAREDESGNTAAEQLFKSYITDIYGATDYMTYEELGTVGENTLAYGMYTEATDTFYTAVLGDWVFRKFYIAAPYKLALYIITDNTVYPLETAYGMGIITDEDLPTVAGLTQRVSVHKMSFEEKAVYKYIKDKGLYTSSNYSYKFVGHLDALLSVVEVQTNDYDYSEVIGDYQVFSEPNPWLFAKGTQLFVVGDLELNENDVWSLKEACDNEIVKMEKVKELCEKENVSGVHIAPYISDTEPTSEVPASSETAPSLPESSEPATNVTEATEPTYDVSDPVVKALMKQYDIKNPDDIMVDYRQKLKNGMYLVHYESANFAYDCAIHNDWIGKYIYTYNDGGADKQLFDGKKFYKLTDAYQKGVISSAELKEISSYLPTMKEYKKTIKAGQSKYISSTNLLSALKVSNKKVLKLDTEMNTVYGLTKGSVIVSAKMKGGKECTCKVTVTTNPKLSKNSIKVKKGKTVKIKIAGKVKSINNKYTNTKIAKIIAKKSDTTIKVKGLKKGTTNLKVTVNGKKLNLKVTVK